jgi:hypothetical protein
MSQGLRFGGPRKKHLLLAMRQQSTHLRQYSPGRRRLPSIAREKRFAARVVVIFGIEQPNKVA